MTIYDNALLAIAYLEAYQATGKINYADIARQVFTYVLRDMTSPEGAFYSAEDADSEGTEGKFYVWIPDEIKSVRVLADPGYAKSAQQAIDFILKHLRRDDGRLTARYRHGETAHLGYVDDYAFLAWGLLELYETTFKEQCLTLAIELTRDMVRLFQDKEGGGLFLYGSDAETLIARPKELYDGVIPSGNSVAAVNLIRLSRLTGDDELAQIAQSQFQAFGGTVSEIPTGHTHFLMAAYLNIASPIEVALAGEPGRDDLAQLTGVVNSGFRPNLVVSLNQPGKTPMEGKAAAYVCKDFSCMPPVTDKKQLAEILNNASSPQQAGV